MHIQISQTHIPSKHIFELWRNGAKDSKSKDENSNGTKNSMSKEDLEELLKESREKFLKDIEEIQDYQEMQLWWGWKFTMENVETCREM